MESLLRHDPRVVLALSENGAHGYTEAELLLEHQGPYSLLEVPPTMDGRTKVGDRRTAEKVRGSTEGSLHRLAPLLLVHLGKKLAELAVVIFKGARHYSFTLSQMSRLRPFRRLNSMAPTV